MTEQLYTNIPPLRPCMCGHGDHYQINGRCLTSGCGCAGRTVDKTGASEAEFRARVAVFDAAPTPPECDPERVETVARAMWKEAAAGRPDAASWEDATDYVHDFYRRLAAAAIAADPSPEEAVKRVEALAAELEREVAEDAQRCRIPAEDFAKVWRADAPNRLRAALASPAPAPQGEPDIGDTCCGRCPGSSCYVDQVTGA